MPPRPPTPRLPATERRARILDAALPLLAAHGYQASMGNVASASGVTRTVLYHYFPSKERLVLAVFEAQTSKLVLHIAQTFDGGASQRQRARQVVGVIVAFAEDQPDAWSLLFDHDLSFEPAIAEARRDVHDRAMAAMAVIFASDVAAAGLDADRDRLLLMAEGALGAAVSVVRWWRAHPHVTRETVADGLFDLLWTGASGLGERRDERARDIR